MVTLERCAAALRKSGIHLDKKELTEFRNYLYQLAVLQVEDYNNTTNTDSFLPTLAWIRLCQ